MNRIRPWMKGDVFLFEGLSLTMSDEEIKSGDTYVAGRNTGPHLLTARKVVSGCIFPCEAEYAFDIYECRKVVAIDGEPVTEE